MKKVVSFLAIFILGCQATQNISKKSVDQFSFFESSLTDLSNFYTELKDDGEVEINGKRYLQKALKNNEKDLALFLISKSALKVVEVIKFEHLSEANFLQNNSEIKTYTPKCLNKSNSMTYNISKKEMLLKKEDKIIFLAKSDLIEDRIKDDQKKLCVNKWGH